MLKRKLFAKKSERATHVEAMEKALTDGDTATFEKEKAVVEGMNAEIENIEAVIAEKGRFDGAPEVPGAEPKTEKKVSGIEVMCKMIRREKLTDDEAASVQKALITGADAVNGENNLVPVDVQTEIRELRKSYPSAKELVNVVPVQDLSGSTNFESGAPSGLTAFDDGDTIATETDPTFVKKSWAIAFYGKLIPISRILIKHAKGLMSYLNSWFVRNAVISENAKIFTVLKGGYNSGTPKDVPGWEALKESITVDLDPAVLNDGVIVTNQGGFATLDKEVDADGRPVLQPNPAEPTRKQFQGLDVIVFPTAQLANIDSTHFPIFYGSLKAAADFMEYDSLMFETSEHFLFNKNQTCLRVIEGFDCISTDTSAYIYGSFTATA